MVIFAFVFLLHSLPSKPHLRIKRIPTDDPHFRKASLEQRLELVPADLKQLSFKFSNLHEHHLSHVYWFCIEQEIVGSYRLELKNFRSKHFELSSDLECFRYNLKKPVVFEVHLVLLESQSKSLVFSYGCESCRHFHRSNLHKRMPKIFKGFFKQDKFFQYNEEFHRLQQVH